MSEALTIVKVGTGVLTKAENGTLDGAAVVPLVTALAGLVQSGQRCILVSSGAVGSGVSAFHLESYPRDIATKQACAAVGQAKLMQTYGSLFGNFGITVAQVLLTAHDLQTAERKNHVSATLHRLLEEKNIIPIVNENDSVAVEELRVGDNDQLSVQVAILSEATRLIILTSADGLLPPNSQEPISEVKDIEQVLDFVRDDQGKFSMGGMASKLQAVKLAVDSGIETWIANGRKPDRITAICENQATIGTKFLSQK